MAKKYKIYLLIALFIVLLYSIKSLNLTWVETTEEGAKVTINFLVPMDKESFNSNILFTGFIPDYPKFGYSIKWLNSHTVEIFVTENNLIKGQTIKMNIKNAPTLYPILKKTVNTKITFKSDIRLLSQFDNKFISSTSPFLIQFNTPIDIHHIYKYIQSNAGFDISYYRNKSELLFKPHLPLENNKTYSIIFKAGMRALNGHFLKEDIPIYLSVDKKPCIISTYPENGDKWIGLYPCFSLVSKEPVKTARALLDGKVLPLKKVDDTHFYFLPKNLLQQERTYVLTLETEAYSGEKSIPKEVVFSTTTLRNNRFWIEIKCSSPYIIKCYEGTKCVKQIPYILCTHMKFPRYGTYYLQDKMEIFENSETKVGANHWISITPNFGIHGDTRDVYWRVLDKNTDPNNLMVSDEDAQWLASRVEYQTMVIIRK